MKYLVALLTLLTACGGAEFTTLDIPQDDAGFHEGAPHFPGFDAAGVDSARGDAGSEGDGNTDAAEGSSSVDAADAGVDACTVGAIFTCYNNYGTMVMITPPQWFCIFYPGTFGGDGAGTTPAACSSCETYTCACILANDSLAKTCSGDSAGQLTVYY